ncbi:hypothetical protein XENOCAPTIV_022266 [Xenoophorus captivus]|uniref:Uncharacterized protein n=1 Tax=Xenoophorus captivus TaxID=1517983 RepID=A0ABV0RN47_9TELE
MECNIAHTQCTIALVRRPCQELTGWTELCQSHYDNEYNTYAHEVVWKKIGGVWRRSLGGGLNLCRDRWGILSLLYWLQLTSDLTIMVWLMTYAALFHYSAASPDASIKTQQGGMYLPVISYIWKDPKDGFWLPTLRLLDGRVVAIGAHGSSDSPPRGTEVKGCQVAITTAEAGTQTSVTTKSVTCQTSAGDDEEQHQPVSLEELVSQTSPSGHSMREETGPPQQSDGLLAEVMSIILPQHSPPPSPLPPILSPLHSPVDTIAHGKQRTPAADGSPSPPVLQREPESSPLLMHPDFIDEFEVLDVWSPPPVPRSPYYSDYLEDEVLSLCVYDTDLVFL